MAGQIGPNLPVATALTAWHHDNMSQTSRYIIISFSPFLLQGSLFDSLEKPLFLLPAALSRFLCLRL